MPDGASPITALSWSEVEQIRSRFDSLSPYNRKIVPQLLRLTDENYDKNGAQRQLFGLSIAAKRYALYTTNCEQPYCGHRNCLTVVDPKAHGLIFCAPSEERENGLPKWWWELWRFLLTLEFKQIIEPDFNVLMVAGRAINVETGTDVDGQPSWIALPAMMKMRISTPHYLGQMKGKASPFGFVLHPRTRDKLKLTLLTPFSKNRAGGRIRHASTRTMERAIAWTNYRERISSLWATFCAAMSNTLKSNRSGPTEKGARLTRAGCCAE